MVLAVDAQIDILNLVFFARPSTSSIFQTVSPTISRQVGDHTDFVQEEPQGPQWSTKILATCVVEDVPIFLDILALECSATFWSVLHFDLSVS